jgi:four helix bundle protein
MNTKTAKLQEKLLKRTFNFSNNLIQLLVKLQINPVNNILVKQLIRSGTSIGANYREACEAESSKDFIHKLRISKKECRESSYWIELLIRNNQKFANELSILLNEVNEFTKIFSSIIKKFN